MTDLSKERLEEILAGAKFRPGDIVTKISGSSWTGTVCGFYTTELTPRGYCVNSINEPNSVQIYPEQSLGLVARAARNGGSE